MSKKDKDQLSLDLPTQESQSGGASSPTTQVKATRPARIYRLDELQQKRERIEEGKYIRAIIDMVRHYK